MIKNVREKTIVNKNRKIGLSIQHKCQKKDQVSKKKVKS